MVVMVTRLDASALADWVWMAKRSLPCPVMVWRYAVQGTEGLMGVLCYIRMTALLPCWHLAPVTHVAHTHITRCTLIKTAPLPCSLGQDCFAEGLR